MARSLPFVALLLAVSSGSVASRAIAAAPDPAVATTPVAATSASPTARTPVAPRAASATTSSHAFTYQGLLRNAGAPVNGTVDLQFSLWDAAAGGTQLGATQSMTIAVANGLFTVTLNDANQFGTNPFDGRALWVSVDVRSPSGAGLFTTLSPREALTAAPLANGLVPGAVISGTSTSLASPVLDVELPAPDLLGTSAALVARVGGGSTQGSSGGAHAIYADIANGTAVWGGTNDGVALSGHAGGSGIGVWGAAGPSGSAGYFSGPVRIFSTLYMNGDIALSGKLTAPAFQSVLAINSVGPLPLTSATIATHGGTLLIHYSGSGYSTSPNTFIGMTVKVDGNFLDNTGIFANIASTHMAFVPKEWVLKGLAAGNHTISLQALGAPTVTDGGDVFNVTVTELPF